MKKLIIGILLFSLCACSQGPNLCEPGVIESKRLISVGALYHLKYENEGVRGRGWGEVTFIAPIDFANVGDTLGMVDGSWKRVK